MAPGTSLRGHDHDDHGDVEECLVLEGELNVGEDVMRAGDYQRALPGSEHAEQHSRTGALLYFSGTLDFLVR
jgi:quercetin dioxygenase-like cupin family protein